MAFGDIAGIGQLKDALLVTNSHLEAVLAELQETNRQRLELVATELRQVNASLVTLLEQGLPEPSLPESGLSESDLPRSA